MNQKLLKTYRQKEFLLKILYWSVVEKLSFIPSDKSW